jgi:hypothetical protein
MVIACYCTSQPESFEMGIPYLEIWKSKMIEISEFEQKKIYQHHFQPDPRLTYLVLDSFLELVCGLDFFKNDVPFSCE